MLQTKNLKNGSKDAKQPSDSQKSEEKIWRVKRPYEDKDALLLAMQKNKKIKLAFFFLSGNRTLATRVDPNGHIRGWERTRFSTPRDSNPRVAFALQAQAA